MLRLIPDANERSLTFNCEPGCAKARRFSDDWPRPIGWPRERSWPVDPTSISNNEVQCDSCSETSCQCLSDSPRTKPWIKDLGKREEVFTQWPAHLERQPTAKDERIGCLTGNLAPLHTFDDDRASELVRANLNDESVCQVDCANTGNCLRLLNDSCKPSARFIFKKVSGKYRATVVAVRDIYDGEEITVNAGGDIWLAKSVGLL